MTRAHRLLEKMTDEMELTAEPIPGQPLVELAGECRVYFENHSGIIQYGNDKICVKVRFGHIAVCGSHLSVKRMTREQLVITGKIDSITVCRRNGT